MDIQVDQSPSGGECRTFLSRLKAVAGYPMDMVLIKIATFDGTSLREYKLPFSEQLLLDTSSFLSALVMKILALLLPVASFTLAHPSSPKPLSWEITPTNSQQQFRGLSPVNEKVVWISGTNGTVLRTTDSGSTWTNVSPKFAATENASDFQFRDIQAFSRTTAVTLSIGEGNLSRIYITSDGGKNWKRTFVNEEETAFYDCMSFETRKGRESHGVAMSDPVQGKFRLLETWDGGVHWAIVSNNTMPPALEGEFGFAASGTCIEAAAGRWYLATGGVDPGRIFYTTSPSVSHGWQVANSSIAGGAAAGVFSVRFRDTRHGIAVGGDYEQPTASNNTAAWSSDGGANWHKADSFPRGYRSGVSWIPGRRQVAVAVGTSGSDFTIDGGRNWAGIANGTFDAVECVRKDICWASGSGGRVARLHLRGF